MRENAFAEKEEKGRTRREAIDFIFGPSPPTIVPPPPPPPLPPRSNSNKKCILIFHLRLFWDQVFNPPPPFSSFPTFQRRIIFTPASKRKVDKTFFAPFLFLLTDGRHCIFAQKLVISPQMGARCGLRRVLKVCLFRGGRSR